MFIYSENFEENITETELGHNFSYVVVQGPPRTGFVKSHHQLKPGTLFFNANAQTYLSSFPSPSYKPLKFPPEFGCHRIHRCRSLWHLQRTSPPPASGWLAQNKVNILMIIGKNIMNSMEK